MGFKGVAALAAAASLAAASGCSRVQEEFFTSYDLPESAFVEEAPYPRLADNAASVTPEAARTERERGDAAETALMVDLSEMTTRADRLGDASRGSSRLQSRAADVRRRASQLLE